MPDGTAAPTDIKKVKLCFRRCASLPMNKRAIKLPDIYVIFGVQLTPGQGERKASGLARRRTCRVGAGSSFPVGEGVPPSNDAGVTGEEAMFSLSVTRYQPVLVSLSALSYTIQPGQLLREERQRLCFPGDKVTLCGTQWRYCPSYGRCSSVCSLVVLSDDVFLGSLSLSNTHSHSLTH